MCNHPLFRGKIGEIFSLLSVKHGISLLITFNHISWVNLRKKELFAGSKAGHGYSIVTCQVKGNIRDNKRKTKHIFLFSSNYYNYNIIHIFYLPIYLFIYHNFVPLSPLHDIVFYETNWFISSPYLMFNCPKLHGSDTQTSCHTLMKSSVDFLTSI